MQAHLRLFDQAFEPGTRGSASGVEVTFGVVDLEPLVLPTGILVACDAFRLWKDLPFARHVAPGEYKVEASTAAAPGSHAAPGDERFAFLRVRFAEGTIARWSRALLVGQESRDWIAPEIPGLSIDSGYLGLMDLKTYRTFEKHSREHAALATRLKEKLAARTVSRHAWVNLSVSSQHGDNVLICTSGRGEGNYRSFFGRDESGRVLAWLVDFDVVQPVESSPASAAPPHPGTPDDLAGVPVLEDPRDHLDEEARRIRFVVPEGWEDIEPDAGQLRRVQAQPEHVRFSPAFVPEIAAVCGPVYDNASPRKVLKRVIELNWMIPPERHVARGQLKTPHGEIAWEAFEGHKGEHAIAFAWVESHKFHVLCGRAGVVDFETLKPIFVEAARSFRLVD